MEKTEEKISEVALNETSLKILPKNTLFVAMYGGFNQIGRTGLLKNEATCNQALAAILPESSQNSFYLLTNLNHYVGYWKSIAASSRKDPNITKQDVLDFTFKFPTLPEQTAIGDFFRQLDGQIAAARAIWEKSIQLKKAMLAKMFPVSGSLKPEIRFKGFSGDWERKKLGEVVEIERKGKAQLQQLQTGNIPYLDAEFLNGGKKILTNSDADVNSDDILIIWDGSNAGKVYIGFNGVLGSTLKMYRINSDCSSRFLYQELSRNEEIIFNQYRTPNIPHVIKDFSDEYHFLMPSYEEQTAIGNFFRQLDHTIALQVAELEKLQQLKKGLLAVMMV